MHFYKNLYNRDKTEAPDYRKAEALSSYAGKCGTTCHKIKTKNN